MATQQKRIFFINAVLLSVAVSMAMASTSRPARMPVAGPRSKGDPQAAVHIVEYSDFQCGACQYGNSIIKRYMEQYPSLFYLEARFFPLQSHADFFMASVYAECAAQQNKFWPFHDALFAKRATWRHHDDLDGFLRAMALEHGIDGETLDRCVQDEKTRDIITKEKDEGKARGVRSTPTYFINGTMVAGTKALKAALASYIKEEEKEEKKEIEKTEKAEKKEKKAQTSM